MFDASYLHGVIPGRGLCKASMESACGSSISNSTGSKSSNERRLTFMVGFWREIAATDRGVDRPGPGHLNFRILTFHFGLLTAQPFVVFWLFVHTYTL